MGNSVSNQQMLPGLLSLNSTETKDDFSIKTMQNFVSSKYANEIV